MNKFLSYNKVLVLSPHPDDVEYSISGMIISHLGTQFDILNMTQGGDFDPTTFKTNRLNEVTSFWENISNVNIHFTDKSHLKSMEEDGWVNFIENKFDLSSYDAILTTNSCDSHFEHRQTCFIATALCRVSKVGIIEYSSPSTLVEWAPNHFIDIQEVYKEKVHRLNKFKSQLGRSYFQSEQIKGFHTNFQASKRGLELVEMFRIVQSYG